MRKLSALALMALALVSFAVGCGNKAEEAPPATEPPPAMMDSAMGTPDSMSTMSADSTGH